jgi:hypothetical protein
MAGVLNSLMKKDFTPVTIYIESSKATEVDKLLAKQKKMRHLSNVRLLISSGRKLLVF